MNSFIGVTSSFHLATQYLAGLHPLKREALIFDRIALIDYAGFHECPPESTRNDMIEVDWLMEAGIIVDPNSLITTKVVETEESETLHREIHQRIIRKEKTDKPETREEIVRLLQDEFAIRGMQMRMISSLLRSSAGIDAYPVTLFGPRLEDSNQCSEVIEVVLDQFPTPDENTAWEQILEFRSDPDSRRKYFALRNWFTDLTQKNATPKEVEQKLEHLMAEYQHHMNIHRIKTGLTSLRTIVLAETGFITSGWIAGHSALAGILGMIVSPLFTLRQRQVTLMEEEQKAPGKEIAYLLDASDAFKAKYFPA